MGVPQCLEYDGSSTHATRSGNRRCEGCDGGYYHLHRNLNDFLLHTLFRLNVSWRRSDTWGLAPMIASLIYQCVPVPCVSLDSSLFTLHSSLA